VLGLRHDDGHLHHFAVSRPISVEDGGPLATLLAKAGPAGVAIKSRWQHDAVPPWHPSNQRQSVRSVRRISISGGERAFPLRLCAGAQTAPQTTARSISFPRSQTEESYVGQLPEHPSKRGGRRRYAPLVRDRSNASRTRSASIQAA
jgi:hypothetical protein